MGENSFGLDVVLKQTESFEGVSSIQDNYSVGEATDELDYVDVTTAEELRNKGYEARGGLYSVWTQ